MQTRFSSKTQQTRFKTTGAVIGESEARFTHPRNPDRGALLDFDPHPDSISGWLRY